MGASMISCRSCQPPNAFNGIPSTANLQEHPLGLLHVIINRLICECEGALRTVLQSLSVLLLQKSSTKALNLAIHGNIFFQMLMGNSEKEFGRAFDDAIIESINF